jgi:mono/diheme cytochrome c family protein
VKPERLLPLILVIVGAAFFYSAYRKKTAQVLLPAEFAGNRPVELFYQHQCVTCHWVTSIPDARGKLGPGLDDVGNRALKYDPRHEGEDYLRESILEPAKVVREGFINGMPSFRDELSAEDLEIMVQWLKQLKVEKSDKV